MIYLFSQRARNAVSFIGYAAVAELADALDSGSSGGCTVGVQVPSAAPKRRTSVRRFSVGSSRRNALRGERTCRRSGRPALESKTAVLTRNEGGERRSRGHFRSLPLDAPGGNVKAILPCRFFAGRYFIPQKQTYWKKRCGAASFSQAASAVMQGRFLTQISEKNHCGTQKTVL